MSTRIFEDDVLFLQRLLKSAGLYAGSLDGLWGPKTETAVRTFEQRTQEIAAAMGTFDMRTESSIRTLHLKAQQAARAFMKAVQASLGAAVAVRILSGTRTYAEQDALFRKGRFGNPGPRVTNARGGQSNHNFGIAWDIGLFLQGTYRPDSPLYKKAAQAALDAGIEGLEWGGNWESFPDEPHYQIGTMSGLSLSALRRRFEKGQVYVSTVLKTRYEERATLADDFPGKS